MTYGPPAVPGPVIGDHCSKLNLVLKVVKTLGL